MHPADKKSNEAIYTKGCKCNFQETFEGTKSEIIYCDRIGR